MGMENSVKKSMMSRRADQINVRIKEICENKTVHPCSLNNQSVKLVNHLNSTLCITKKSGSSSFREFLEKKNNLQNISSASDLPTVTGLNSNHVRYNIVLSRHPLTRLVSGYTQKI